MPIYLCQPGTSSTEPWRHGIQVYERPFPLYQDSASSSATTKKNNKDERSSRRKGPEQVVVVTSSSSSSDDEQQQYDEKLAALQRYLTEYIINPDSTTTRTSGNNATYTKNRALIFCSNGTSLKIVKELMKQNGLATTTTLQSQNKMTVLPLEASDNTNVYNKIEEFTTSDKRSHFVGGGSSCNVLVVENDSGMLYKVCRLYHFFSFLVYLWCKRNKSPTVTFVAFPFSIMHHSPSLYLSLSNNRKIH